MRYVMRQKLLSWGDDFVIRDEGGRDVFFVDGKAFSLGLRGWLVPRDRASCEGGAGGEPAPDLPDHPGVVHECSSISHSCGTCEAFSLPVG
jgi:hypothetical protein